VVQTPRTPTRLFQHTGEQRERRENTDKKQHPVEKSARDDGSTDVVAVTQSHSNNTDDDGDGDDGDE